MGYGGFASTIAMDYGFDKYINDLTNYKLSILDTGNNYFKCLIDELRLFIDKGDAHYYINQGNKFQFVINIICIKLNCFSLLEKFFDLTDSFEIPLEFDTVHLGAGLFGYSCS